MDYFFCLFVFAILVTLYVGHLGWSVNRSRFMHGLLWHKTCTNSLLVLNSTPALHKPSSLECIKGFWRKKWFYCKAILSNNDLLRFLARLDFTNMTPCSMWNSRNLCAVVKIGPKIGWLMWTDGWACERCGKRMDAKAGHISHLAKAGATIINQKAKPFIRIQNMSSVNITIRSILCFVKYKSDLKRLLS